MPPTAPGRVPISEPTARPRGPVKPEVAYPIAPPIIQSRIRVCACPFHPSSVGTTSARCRWYAWWAAASTSPVAASVRASRSTSRRISRNRKKCLFRRTRAISAQGIISTLGKRTGRANPVTAQLESGWKRWEITSMCRRSTEADSPADVIRPKSAFACEITISRANLTGRERSRAGFALSASVHFRTTAITSVSGFGNVANSIQSQSRLNSVLNGSKVGFHEMVVCDWIKGLMDSAGSPDMASSPIAMEKPPRLELPLRRAVSQRGGDSASTPGNNQLEAPFGPALIRA